MMKAALSPEERLYNMAYAKEHGPKGIQDKFVDGGRISIVGFGPSLRETWKDIQHPIMATSGAQQFLAERGVHCDYYVGLDPRIHKTYWLRKPDPRTLYLMASISCPFTWAMLEGCQMLQWHAIGVPGSSTWALENDPDTFRLRTGSTVGLGAFRLAWKMGWRSFDLFGMDHTEGYAADCPNPSQNTIYYKGLPTTPQLLFSAIQMAQSIGRCVPGTVRVHGPSLVKLLMGPILQPITIATEGNASIIIPPDGETGFNATRFLEELRLRDQPTPALYDVTPQGVVL